MCRFSWLQVGRTSLTHHCPARNFSSLTPPPGDTPPLSPHPGAILGAPRWTIKLWSQVQTRDHKNFIQYVKMTLKAAAQLMCCVLMCHRKCSPIRPFGHVVVVVTNMIYFTKCNLNQGAGTPQTPQEAPPPEVTPCTTMTLLSFLRRRKSGRPLGLLLKRNFSMLFQSSIIIP